MRSRIVSRESLNRLGKKVNLETHIQYRASKNSNHSSLLGNVFEALIGAIYLDKGYIATKKIVSKFIFSKHIDLSVVEQTNTDYKSQLLIQCQKQQKKLSYKELNKAKIEGEFYFTMGLFIDNEIITQATAKSKRKAEQEASKKVLLSQ
jgi:ribonuclease-3